MANKYQKRLDEKLERRAKQIAAVQVQAATKRADDAEAAFFRLVVRLGVRHYGLIDNGLLERLDARTSELADQTAGVNAMRAMLRGRM